MRKLLALAFLLALGTSPAFARQRIFGWCELGNQTVAVQGYVSPTLVQASYPQCTVTVYQTGSQSVQTGKYLSGGTIVGSAGQTVTLFLNGGTGATATATLTSTNTIAPGSALLINTPGNGFSASPTTANCSSGTATCSGTVQIQTTVIGTLATLYADNNGTVLSNPFIASKQGWWYFYPDNGRVDVQQTLGTPNPMPNAFTEGDVLALDPVFDSEFSSVTQACSFAAALPTTLTVTKAWLNLPTQTFACDLLFQKGGSFQPASGQVLTLGSMRAGVYKIFDLSQGGTIGALVSAHILPEWWGSITQACAFANGVSQTLYVTQPWTNIATQTLPCLMSFETGGMLQPASGATLTVRYPHAAMTQQIFNISTGMVTLTSPAGKMSVAWWGAKNGADSSAAFMQAMLVASSSTTTIGNPQHVWVPSGTYLTSTLTQITYGVILEGEGPTSSIIKSLSGGNVMEFNPTVTGHGIQIKNLGVDGNGGSNNYGIFFHGGATGTFNVLIQQVIVTNVGASCVYLPEIGSFQTNIDQSECSSLNGNGIEVRSGPATVIQNTYVHTVGAGKAAYRIYGTALLMSANAMDANDHGIALQIGNNSPLSYGSVTAVNCNFEYFGSIGIDVVEGFFKLVNTTLLGNQPGSTVQLVRFEATYVNGVSEVDAQSTLYDTGNFPNGVAIHAAQTCPPLLIWNVNSASQSCYSEVVGGSYNTLQATQTVVAFLLNAMNFNVLATPDFFVTHTQASGATPTISTHFGAAGDAISGFDAAGQVIIGSAPTNAFGAIQWASVPGYHGLATNCTVSYLATPSPEEATVNISAPDVSGLSTVSWVAGTKFNLGWHSGLPTILGVGGTSGILFNNVISTVTSPISMTITPGVPGGVTGAFLVMPIRTQYLSVSPSTVGLTINTIFPFVPGDILNWQCIGR